ncbi:MAG: chemotaxis protein CheW [Ruminococcus sp.]|nr:chemotaxis protein CheW [Ruminococcus sp.]
MEDIRGRAVTFLSDGKTFAIDMDNIIEINSRGGETFIPGLPDCITGVINHKGDVIPVMDLRKRMGYPPADTDENSLDKTSLMLVQNDEDILALRIDEAVTAVEYDIEQNFMALDDEGVLLGFINTEEGERISLFNVAKLIDLDVKIG